MPVIIAPIAVATIWKWMYDPFFGLFNAMLTALGLDGLIQDWLGDAHVALYSMFVAYVWQSVGFSMVLFLAGLQGVSQTLAEAARIDGASRFQSFRYVTLPALRASITIVAILSIINSLKAFDIVYGMTLGGPAQSTQMLALWAFTQAMQLGDFGRGRCGLDGAAPDHHPRSSCPTCAGLAHGRKRGYERSRGSIPPGRV